jgi:hypothetical protein
MHGIDVCLQGALRGLIVVMKTWPAAKIQLRAMAAKEALDKHTALNKWGQYFGTPRIMPRPPGQTIPSSVWTQFFRPPAIFHEAPPEMLGIDPVPTQASTLYARETPLHGTTIEAPMSVESGGSNAFDLPPVDLEEYTDMPPLIPPGFPRVGDPGYEQANREFEASPAWQEYLQRQRRREIASGLNWATGGQMI